MKFTDYLMMVFCISVCMYYMGYTSPFMAMVGELSEGDGIDTDGDGHIDEDPKDNIDNDGDGSVDEDGEGNPGEQTQSSFDRFLTLIKEVFTSEAFKAVIAVAAIASIATSGGNYGVVYLIPVLMLVAIANIFVLPTSFIFDAGLPNQIKIVINAFLNLNLALAVISFVRGN